MDRLGGPSPAAADGPECCDRWSNQRTYQEAMSDCRRTDERLAPYTDGSLPAAERADVERHLDACPPCHRVAATEQGGRTLLRERAGQLKGEPLPPGLRSRCEAMARRHADRGRTPAWRAGLIPAVVAA